MKLTGRSSWADATKWQPQLSIGPQEEGVAYLMGMGEKGVGETMKLQCPLLLSGTVIAGWGRCGVPPRRET
jgi:hypothetical protein